MLINIIIIILLLLVIPYMVGFLIFGKHLQIGAKIVVGIIIISFLIGILHAFGANQIVSYIILFILVTISLYKFLCLQTKNIVNIQFNQFCCIRIADVVFHVSLLIILAHGFLLVLSMPISAWDAVAIWYQKAMAYHYWTPIADIPTVNYPNLLPIYWSLLLGWSNNQEGFGRLVFPLIYCLFFNELYLLLRSKQKIDYLICGIIIYFASIFFYDWVYNGYQDQVIFSIAGVAMLYSIKTYKLQLCTTPNTTNNHNEVKSLYLIAILLGSLGFIKNEGVIFSMILTPLPIYLLIKSRFLRSVDLYILPLLYFSLLFFWPMALLYNGIDPSHIQGDAFDLKSVDAIFARFDRIPIIFNYYKSYFNQNFTIILISFLATLLSIFKGKSLIKLVLILWSGILLHALFVMCVFLLTNQELAWHLDTAFIRIMSQHLSLYIIIVLTLFLLDYSKPTDFRSAK